MRIGTQQAQRLRDQLAGSDRVESIPDLYVTLNDVAGTRRGRVHVRPLPGSRPPGDMAVLHLTDARVKDWDDWRDTDPGAGWTVRRRDPGHEATIDRYGVIPALGLWLRLIDEESLDDPDGPRLELDPEDWRDIRRLCRVLADVQSWVIDQPWAEEYVADVARIHGALSEAHGIRREYRPRCRQAGCGAVLDPQDQGSWYACRDCGRQYTVAEDLRALGQAQYMASEDVAQLLDIPWSTFRSWKSRGLVRIAATTAWGQALYDLDHVRQVRDRAKAESDTA